MANNRTCLTCGKEYSYCPTCGSDSTKPAYMAIFCSENCKDISEVATRYYMHKLSKADAQELLKCCDLSNLENYPDSVNRDVTQILDEEVGQEAAGEAKAPETKSQKKDTVNKRIK